jgi:hypothetical protein
MISTEEEELSYEADTDLETEVDVEPEPIVVITKSKNKPKPKQLESICEETESNFQSPSKEQLKREAKKIANLKYRDKNKPVKPIVVEKLVYVMVDKEGNEVEKIDPTKLSRKDEKRILIEEEARKKEIELGMTLKRLKSGKARMPRERTEKQKANDLKLVQLNKERREKAKQAKTEVKTEVKKQSLIDALREIVSIPIEDIKKPTPTPIPEYTKRVKSFSEW